MAEEHRNVKMNVLIPIVAKDKQEATRLKKEIDRLGDELRKQEYCFEKELFSLTEIMDHQKNGIEDILEENHWLKERLKQEIKENKGLRNQLKELNYH